jgi:D-serine deaminase-like pyridoxal phosphate-dependent protein
VTSLRVLIDVDVGQGRTGVTQVADAERLADVIAASPGLVFAGIQGFAGHAQHIVDPRQRCAAAAAAAAIAQWRMRSRRRAIPSVSSPAAALAPTCRTR